MIFNCLVNFICILCVIVDCCCVNCDSIRSCNDTDCIGSEFNLNCSALDDDDDDYNLTHDGTQDGKYGYELTTLSVEGPFFVFSVDGEQDHVNLERSDIRDGQPGINLHLIVRLINSLTCEPMVGVYVHVWQANGLGVYSGVDNNNDPTIKVKRSTDGSNFVYGGGPDFWQDGRDGPGFGRWTLGSMGHWIGEGFDSRGAEGPFNDFIQQEEGEEDKFDQNEGGNVGDQGGGQGGGGWNQWQDYGPPGQGNPRHLDELGPMKGEGEGGRGRGRRRGGGGGPNDQLYPVDRGPNNQMIKPVDQPTVNQKGDSGEPIDSKLDPIKPEPNETLLMDQQNQPNLNLNQTNINQLDNSIELIDEKENVTISPIVINPDEYNITTELGGSSSTSNSLETELTGTTETMESTPYDPITNTSTVPELTDPPPLNTGHRSYLKKFRRRKPINAERFLRGYQSTNHHGDASFITLIPGWYQQRSQHIHIEVYLDLWSTTTNVTYVGQLYLPTDNQPLMNRVQSSKPYNQIPFNVTPHQDDYIFTQSKGSELILTLEPFGDGYQAIVTIGIDPMATIQPYLD